MNQKVFDIDAAKIVVISLFFPHEAGHSYSSEWSAKCHPFTKQCLRIFHNPGTLLTKYKF